MQASPPTTEIELFVLQRCWFSGPHHEPSVDCLRLFTSRREAEEVGFHAAHEFANQSIFSTNNRSSSASPAPVKTILLPPSTLGATTSSYAFQTCGKLFWVRSLQATVIPPKSFTTTMFAFGNTCPYTKAQVVLTQGIIGGTGNPNSRRGSEVAQGRVFVSMDETLAVQTAVEVGKQVHMAMSNNPNVKITVAALPIGKPPHHDGSTVQDWPPPSSLSLLSPLNNNNHNPQQPQQHQEAHHPMSIVADPSNKREWVSMSTTTTTAGAFQQQAINPITNKRQCQVSLSS